MNSTTFIANSTIIVSGSQTGPHTGVIAYNNGTFTATYNPTTDFTPGEIVTVIATIGLQSSNAVALASSYSWNFTVDVSSAGTFAAKIDYPTGVNPSYVIPADLDGDGDVDLASANYAGNTISVVKNNGDGTFSTNVDYTTGSSSNPISITSSDLDGDGDIDLAAANNTNSKVSVFINNGSGVYAAKVDYTTGTNPGSVTTADADGDGDMDLVVANYSSANISVLMNNGDGTFAAKVDYSAGAGSYSVITADMDGDGDMDAATANADASTISILMNNGDGTFAAKVDYSTGSNPINVTSTDVDGDGDIDVAVANNGPSTISVFKNNGDGTFAAKVDYAVGSNINFISPADIDGDNDMDVAVLSNANPGYISVLKNNNDGTFTDKSDYRTGASPQAAAFSDLDGDGDIDVAVVNGNEASISVLLNDTSSTSPNGNSLELGGTGYVLSSTSLGNFGTGNFTLEAWVKTTSVISKVLFGKRFSASHGSFFVFSLTADGRMGMELDEDEFGTNYSATTGVGSVNDGNWHHIAFTRDGTTITYYIDGVQDSQYTTDGIANINNGTEFSIGTRYADGFGYGGFFIGSIEDVRVWSVARSSSEIANNRNVQLSSGLFRLEANYLFNEQTGSTTVDTVTSANNGTLYGDAQFSIVVLPVELSSFSVSPKNNSVELKWNTATEVNNYGFEVERTVVSHQSSVISWNKVGFVEGNGTTNAPKEYSFLDKNLSTGNYLYRLKQVDRDGKFSYSQEVEATIANAPKEFTLEQNYPNPFNPSTVISYQLPVNGHVTLKVYDVIGREVATLVNEVKEAGRYSATFDASVLSSGIYFAKIQSSDNVRLKKMMLLK